MNTRTPEPALPDFSTRARSEEMMDDFSITDSRLTLALDELRYVNRYLGGYATTMRPLSRLLRSERRDAAHPWRILDLGTGLADVPEYIVRWADRNGTAVDIVGVDANPATVAYASATLDERLPGRLRGRLRVEVGDALDLAYDDASFDVVMAALFMHHLEDPSAVRLLRGMQRLSRHGIIVNDLHRHPAAYYAIYAIAHTFPVSPMFRNDGPLSVLRGFRRGELNALARRADLTRYDLSWHWAFRWRLSTIRA